MARRCTLALLCLLLCAKAEATSFAVVAIAGEPAAGLSGVEYQSFFRFPVLNNDGQVAFLASLQGPEARSVNDMAVFAPASDGGLRVVARTGDLAPGASGKTFTGPTGFSPFDAPYIDARGGVAFTASADDEVGFRSGFWQTNGVGPLGLVARIGQPVPGSESDEFFIFISAADVSLGEGGHLAFHGFSGRPDDGPLDSLRVIIGSDGKILASELAQGPGDSLIVRLVREPVIVGTEGGVTFTAVVTTPTGPEMGIIHRSADGALAMLVQAGDQAPGLPIGTEFASSFLFRIGDVNKHGGLAFTAEVAGPGIGQFQDATLWGPDGDGGIRLVMRSGEPLPEFGGTARPGLPGPPQLSDAGRMVFRTTIDQPTLFTQSLWIADPDGTRLMLARAGDPVPGMVGVSFLSLRHVNLNDRGDVLIEGLLEGPGLPRFHQALFLYTIENEFRMVLQKGDPIAVRPDDTRILDSFQIDGGHVTQRGRSVFNDHRQVAFTAIFTDGSQAVIVAHLPEPGLPLLLAVGWLLSIRPCARRQLRSG